MSLPWNETLENSRGQPRIFDLNIISKLINYSKVPFFLTKSQFLS